VQQGRSWRMALEKRAHAFAQAATLLEPAPAVTGPLGEVELVTEPVSPEETPPNPPSTRCAAAWPPMVLSRCQPKRAARDPVQPAQLLAEGCLRPASPPDRTRSTRVPETPAPPTCRIRARARHAPLGLPKARATHPPRPRARLARDGCKLYEHTGPASLSQRWHSANPPPATDRHRRRRRAKPESGRCLERCPHQARRAARRRACSRSRRPKPSRS